MFESKKSKLAPKHIYHKRVRTGLGLSAMLVTFSMVLGTVGYHYICKLGWIDAQLNASMILTGMGPVDPMPNDASKIWASAYAIFSGVTFLTSIAVLLAPTFHRMLHKFHISDSED
jgi:hypothetical protein